MIDSNDRSTVNSARLSTVSEINVLDIDNVLRNNHRFYKIEFEALHVGHRMKWTVLARYSQIR